MVLLLRGGWVIITIQTLQITETTCWYKVPQAWTRETVSTWIDLAGGVSSVGRASSAATSALRAHRRALLALDPRPTRGQAVSRS